MRLTIRASRNDSHQHDDSQRRGSGIIVLFEFGHDQQRSDLRFERHIAGDEDDRAVFPDGARECHRHAGQQGRPQFRHDHRPECLPSIGSQRGGGFLHLPIQILQHRLHGSHHEWQSNEGECNQDTQGCKGDFETQRFEIAPDPSIRRIDGSQGDSGDGGRQGKG